MRATAVAAIGSALLGGALLTGCGPAGARTTPASTPVSSASRTETRAAPAPTAAAPAPAPAPDPAPAAPAPGEWRTEYAWRSALRTLRGRVSYYHDSLAGNSTASGEPYDPRAFTAASRDLPFGTVIRVVREDTGASSIVRVNDRGPFGRRRRLLDLSRAAAEELQMVDRGVVEVRAEILELGSR